MNKGSTKSAITSKGSVNLSVLRDKVVVKKDTIKNTATLNLLNGYANVVNHSFNRQSATPGAFTPLYLGVGNCGDSGKPPAATSMEPPYELVGEINIGKRLDVSVASTSIISLDGTQGIKVVLNAVIPSSACAGGARITEIGLFSSGTINSATMLARIPIINADTGADGTDYGIVIEPGTSLLVEWSIEIKNA